MTSNVPTATLPRRSMIAPVDAANANPQAPRLARVGAVGSYALLAFILLTFTRLQEVGFLRSLRLYTVVLAILFPVMFLSGRWLVGLRSFPGKAFVALTAWIIAGVPFSIWRGGSVKIFIDDWIPSVMTFIVVSAMVGTLRDMRRVIYTAAFSMLVVVLIFFKYTVVVDGRAAVSFGTLSNSNDLAMHLLFALPFLGFVIADGEAKKIARGLAFFIVLPLLWIVMRTGSRAGLVSIGILVLAIFWMCSFMGKVKFVLAAALAATILVSSAPDTLLERYRTLWADDSDASVAEAVASAHSRKELFKESVRQTLLHPVFGVGVGNFQVAFARVREAEGNYFHRFAVSHNTYTQLSSETGILGFLLFCGAAFWCIRVNLKLYKARMFSSTPKHVPAMAVSLLLSMLIFLVASIFGSNGYRFYLPLAAGLTVSLKRVAQEALPPGVSPRNL